VTTRRDGERGLSIIEAIVIATITALLALLILPLLPRASAGSFEVAERSVGALEQTRAERDFRALVRAVGQREIEGEAQPVLEGGAASIVLLPNLPVATACARAGAPVVRLDVVNNALLCVSDGRRRALMRWPTDHVGALAYSANGVVWADSWRGAQAAPYVRFELRRGQRVVATWVERVSGEPS
jgi:hypothetical protein